MRSLISGLALLLALGPAFAADNITVKDATGSNLTMRSKDTGSGIQAPGHVLVDSSGALLGLSAWGVAPTGNVQGVNSYVLSLPALAAGSNTIGSIANISGTISLPTGASTAANQTAIQGTVAAGTAATKSVLTGGVYNSSAPTLTTGQQVALQTDVNGNLKTTIANVNNNGAATAANSAPTTPSNLAPGAATVATGQVSVGTTATQIAAARTGVAGTGRVSLTITNTTTTAMYVGGSGVSTTTGQLLPGVVGASITVNATAALYGIVASGTATATFLEVY